MTALAASPCDEELRLRRHRAGEEPRRGRSQVESDLGHRRDDLRVLGRMKGVLALRAYQPFACRVYPVAAAP